MRLSNTFLRVWIVSRNSLSDICKKRIQVKLRIFLITSALILFAILDEYHQKFIPGRAFNLKDIYSDIFGIIAALVFCIAAFKIISRNNA
ncbi:MAG: VanZ family protein [Bacteroidales bacterium]|nr:VanZ family protein [Bacteroidales bacterium]